MTFNDKWKEEFEKEFSFSDAENPINIYGTQLHNELLSHITSRQNSLLDEIVEQITKENFCDNHEFCDGCCGQHCTGCGSQDAITIIKEYKI